MIATKDEIKAVNFHFKKFVLEKNHYSSDTELNKLIDKISKDNEADFSKNWENIICLTQMIENVYNVKSIVTEDNYFRFEFNNNENIQDKGETKIEALFGCCYKTLKKYWNEKAPNLNNGIEPFDLEEFEEENNFNVEELKEKESEISKNGTDKFKFDQNFIESKFSKAERFLFNKDNIHAILYENFEVSSFDRLNSKLLKSVSNNYIIYCLWLGKSHSDLEPKYIGHAKNTISRQRLRAHFTKKNKATGAQLDKIKKNLDEKKYFGLTYLVIEPSYMRTSLEEWLINKNIDKLEWNKNR